MQAILTCAGERPMTMALGSPLEMLAPPLASTMPTSYGACDAAARSAEMACDKNRESVSMRSFGNLIYP